MPQRTGPRLDARNRAIYLTYLSATPQVKIAEEHGLTQQQVSDIIAAERGMLPDADRAAISAEDLFRTEVMLHTAMERYLSGDSNEGKLALRLMEHRAKVIGSYAPEPLSVTVARGVDVSGTLVANATGAVIRGALATVPSQSPQFQKEYGDYLTALAQRELLSADGDSEDELPPEPVPPVWSETTAPVSRHTTIRPGQPSEPVPDRAAMQRWIAEDEAKYGSMDAEDDDED